MTTVSPPAPGLVAPKRHKQKLDWTGWKFVGPFMLVFALVLIAPVIYSIYLSLFKEQLIGGNSFVGLDNYAQALGDARFWESLGRVTLFLVVQVPIMLILALAAALALDSARLYISSFFRIAIFLPYAVPAVVATLMWGFIYGTQFGLVGDLNDFLGTAFAPLSNTWVLASVGNIVTWEFVGYNMLLFYAALRVIPVDLYEAAELDGAGAFRIIRSIKLPALRPAIVIGTIFSIIGSFQLFNEPNILQSLAPNSITTYFTPNMYAYNLSFSGQQYNYSATIAIIVGLLTAVIAYVVQLTGSRKES
ncbi:multiple sugar transport system permease protein [Conyzicola lurida]|uniref:Multiple sugar transport system permease protein n=1 Tax=Conyzicola lurida TaxID=1172621 RepID=A0A841AS02_9MICO|nr:sugar ABC transporter permease [Conyzicola lurida]MBB5844456.1 multiple sugar transport system permease protein [Conyzicola lurida]